MIDIQTLKNQKLPRGVSKVSFDHTYRAAVLDISSSKRILQLSKMYLVARPFNLGILLCTESLSKIKATITFVGITEVYIRY